MDISRRTCNGPCIEKSAEIAAPLNGIWRAVPRLLKTGTIAWAQ